MQKNKEVNIELISKALEDAYSLLCQEKESVCVDWLNEEYEQVLNTLTCAIEEVKSNEEKKKQSDE